MLILTRRANQSIQVGSDITVKILSIQGTQVRLGIKAPKDIPVHRDEVARRIRLEHADE
jgi:carbon storage regulator